MNENMNENVNALEPPCKTAPTDFKAIVLANIKDARQIIAEINQVRADGQTLTCNRLKKAVDAIIADDLKLLDVQLTSIESLVTTEISVAKKIEDQRKTPIYADVLRSNGQVESHILYETCKKFYPNPTGKIIRTYNRANEVLFEDPRDAGACRNYNDLMKRAAEIVKEKLQKGKLGLTTKFNNAESEYDESEQQMWDKALNKSPVELSEEDKLPDALVDRVNSLSDAVKTAVKTDAPKSPADAVSKTSVKKTRIRAKKQNLAKANNDETKAAK